MTVEFRDYLARVRPEATHAPSDLLVQAMLDTTRDFCVVTRALQYEVTDEVILANVSDYDILTPNDQVEPIAIEYMSLNGAEVIFKEVAWLNRFIANWRLRPADDFRYFTHLTGPDVYTFPCVPQTGQTGLYYRVSLHPRITATKIDEAFIGKYVEAISDGAKARLLAMSGKEWTNKDRAKELDGAYRQARGLARIEINNTFGNAEQRWTNPRGFA